MICRLAYREVLEKGINEANKRAESDKALKDVLKQYNGRRVVINVVDDTTYAFSISTEGVSLTTPTTSNPEDMYLEINSKIVEKILNREIDPLKLISMVLFGDIKMRNIGPKDIELIQNYRFLNSKIYSAR